MGNILELHYLDRIRILREFGADMIELKCPVFDYMTTDLLIKAGAIILDHRQQKVPSFYSAVIVSEIGDYIWLIVSSAN